MRRAGTAAAVPALRISALISLLPLASAALVARINGNPIRSIYVYSRPEWTALVTRKDTGISKVADKVDALDVFEIDADQIAARVQHLQLAVDHEMRGDVAVHRVAVVLADGNFLMRRGHGWMGPPTRTLSMIFPLFTNQSRPELVKVAKWATL